MTAPAPIEHHDPPDEQTVTDGNVFRCEGDYWTVIFDGLTVRVRELKGMRYLARLLTDPGREYHVLDLAAAATAHGPQRDGTRMADLPRSALGDAGAILDPQARNAYRRRLTEIDDDLDHARATGDTERATQATAERDFLVRELAHAFGLSGRDRRAASPSERARAAVNPRHPPGDRPHRRARPPLGQHLTRTIRTGTYCYYLPDPRAPARWQL